MPDIQIIRGYIPGSIGRVAELHATYYHQQWGFGLFFEANLESPFPRMEAEDER